MKKQRNKMELFSIRIGVATRHHWFDRTGATSYDVDNPLLSGFKSKAKATANYREWKASNASAAVPAISRVENTMKKSKVALNHRNGFTPRLFGTKYIRRGSEGLGYAFVVGENIVFDYTAGLTDDYKECSGYWEFFKVANGAMFMMPSHDKPFNVANADNYFEGELSAEALGIVSTIVALGMIHQLTGDDALIQKIDLLKDYAEQLPESALIFRAID